MHGNMDSHPDLPGLLQDLEKAANAYERKQKIAATMIVVGTSLTAAGTAYLKIEQMRMKYSK